MQRVFWGGGWSTIQYGKKGEVGGEICIATRIYFWRQLDYKSLSLPSASKKRRKMK